MSKELDEITEFRFESKGKPDCGGFRDEDAAYPHPRRRGGPTIHAFIRRCLWVLTRSVRLLRALDRNRRVTAVPFQKSSVPASVGLTLKECEAAAWTIAHDGARYRGAEAVCAVVAVARGTSVPLFLYSLPGIRQLLDLIYYLVASNRSRLPGDRPYCAQHPAGCR